LFGELAASTDPRVLGLLSDVGSELGIVTSWLINLYNPDVLVIAGGFLEAGDQLMKPLRQTAMASALRQASNVCDVRPSSLGEAAAVRGATLLALQASDRSYRLAFSLGGKVG
jgi:glucokinase